MDNYVSDVGRELPVGATIGPIRGTFAWEPGNTDTNPIILASLLFVMENFTVTTAQDQDIEIAEAMWWLYTAYSSHIVEVAAGTFSNTKDIYPIETKAQRKVKQTGDRLVLQLQEVSGVDTVVAHAQGHIMVKLP